MLTPCTYCRRHVGIAEVWCPFCHHALPWSAPRAVIAGRVSRAVVFVAASLAAANCHPSGVTPAEPAVGVGTVSGVVRWEGASLVGGSQSGTRSGVKVYLVDENGAVRQSVKTDGRGVYQFTNVPRGIYTVRLRKEHDDYSARTATVTVEIDDSVTQHADLLSHFALPYGAPPARRRRV